MKNIFKIWLIVGLLLLPNQGKADGEVSWLTFFGITALSTGTTLLLTYVGGELVLNHIARKVGQNMAQELEKKVKELKKEAETSHQEERYRHLVSASSIKMINYINPPKEILSLILKLKNKKRYEHMDVKVPHGILITGDPGTGKTHLARALAGELDCPFFEYSATEFINKFIGESGSQIRNAFNEARTYAKNNGKEAAILFIDEFDAIASREDNHIAENDLVNTLLTCMDGFTQQNPAVIVIAATNHLEKIDLALKRTGRFDVTIYIPYPDMDTREKLFLQKTKKTKIDKTIGVGLEKKLARMTDGFSHADVIGLVGSASEIAIEKNIDGVGINYDCFARAMWSANQKRRIQLFSTRSQREKILKQCNIEKIEHILAETENMTLQDLQVIIEQSNCRYGDCTDKEIQGIIARKKRERRLNDNKEAVEICRQLYSSIVECDENVLADKTPEEIFEENLKKHTKNKQ